MTNMTSAVLENILIFLLEIQMSQNLPNQYNAAACQSLKKLMIPLVSVALQDMLLEVDNVIELSVLAKVAVTSTVVMNLTTSCM